MRRPLVIALALLVVPAALAAPAVETRPPNAAGQKPAFEGQTRAPAPDGPARVAVPPVAGGLGNAWALEFLPDGAMLVTEKAGRMRIVRAGSAGREGRAGPPLEGLPRVDARGQGGLLDVALGPDFPRDNLVYWSFAEPREGGNGTSVARGRLVRSGEGGRIEGAEVIFRQTPTYDGTLHYGSRLVFAPDGRLFVTVGERSDPGPRAQAQSLSSGLGKVFRIEPDGAVPKDNPFAGRDGALPTIWSYGHRNVQSAALDGRGRLWTVEHGPRGGDELNRPEGAQNYGWPDVTYGIDYSGRPIGAGITAKAGTEQPAYYWDPVIAPSGMAWYDGGLIPEWTGAFLVGGLQSEGIVVLRLAGDRVASEERLPLGARTRDVKVGPDGAVYALTERDGGGSHILRIAPPGR